MTFFGKRSGFEQCPGNSSMSNHWPPLRVLSKNIHFSSHVMMRFKKGWFRWGNSRDDATSNLRFCWFSVKRWWTHLSSFFFFSINLRCIETVVGGIPSSNEISRTVFLGLASTTALSHSSSTEIGRPRLVLSLRLVFPERNLLNHLCTVLSFTLGLPNALLILALASVALWPSLNSYWKIMRKSHFFHAYFLIILKIRKVAKISFKKNDIIFGTT